MRTALERSRQSLKPANREGLSAQFGSPQTATMPAVQKKVVGSRQ